MLFCMLRTTNTEHPSYICPRSTHTFTICAIKGMINGQRTLISRLFKLWQHAASVLIFLVTFRICFQVQSLKQGDHDHNEYCSARNLKLF